MKRTRLEVGGGGNYWLGVGLEQVGVAIALLYGYMVVDLFSLLPTQYPEHAQLLWTDSSSSSRSGPPPGQQ